MRSTSPVQRLTATTFPAAASAHLFFLVRVEAGLPRLHRGLRRFFHHQYPGLFGFGTLPLRETRRPGWWEHHFRTAVGPVRGSRTGYFLFHEGDVVGHHSGAVRADIHFTDAAATDDDRRRGQAELAWIKRVAFGAGPVSPVDLAAAVDLIVYFDGVVVDRQARSGFDADGNQVASGARAGGVTPQPVAIPGASRDPFQVLKIPFEATQDEIRAAYKLQMKLNHPDKVSHMSEEIQAYAHAQVKVIRAAYEALRKR